jgi:hypothetical protein
MQTEQFAIELKPVVSSNLKAIGYDAATKTLAVQFANGVYTYTDVSPELFESFQDSESKGKFFQQYIRPKFKAVKQTPLAEELANIVEAACSVVDGAK